MPTIGQDLFTEASDTQLGSHTPNVGSGWLTEEDVQFEIQAADDNLAHKAASIQHAKKADNIGDDDMDVSADCSCKNSAARMMGICGRMPSVNWISNSYQLYLKGDGTNVDVKLDKLIGGSRTELGSYDANIAQGTLTTLKLEIRAAAKKGFVSGVERINSADDNLLGNNFAGLVCNGSTVANQRIDNFLSESVAASATITPPVGSKILSGLAPIMNFGIITQTEI